jgi:hypothetical protein
MQRTAQCHCGALQVSVFGEPDWVNICHCRACQRRTGTIVHAGAYFPVSAVTVTGARKTYVRPADSGYAICFFFCPQCGSNIFWQANRFPQHYGVAVGGFADSTFPSPTFSVWEETMHRWLLPGREMEHSAQGRVGKPIWP